MPFEDQFERYAMQLETMTKNGRLFVNAGEIGKALGLHPDESLIVAHYLEDAGWVKVLEGNPADGSPALSLRLNLEGRRAVARLHWPRWRRWAYGNLAIVLAIVALINSIVMPLLTRLVP